MMAQAQPTDKSYFALSLFDMVAGKDSLTVAPLSGRFTSRGRARTDLKFLQRLGPAVVPKIPLLSPLFPP